MIGVLCARGQLAAASELFELFKTPWAPYNPDKSYDVVLVNGEPRADVEAPLVVVFGTNTRSQRGGALEIDGTLMPLYGDIGALQGGGTTLAFFEGGRAAALESRSEGRTLIQCGYDLLDEVRRLLTDGQPPENAAVPTLDLHVDLLRRWILRAGVQLVEVPPAPFGSSFVACLTHDIDFLRLRDHRFDHTMAGFLYRATAGSLRDAVAGRHSWQVARRNVGAALAAPLVHLGLRRDPWSPFESYVEADGDRRSTFFVVPFRGRVGQRVNAPRPQRRAVRYDVAQARPSIEAARALGFEIAVHGIDAWMDAEKGREELGRIAETAGEAPTGIRMHWLCYDRESPRLLEEAGFEYDASVGYNDAVGFRAGTTQVYRPLNASALLELPLHVQDTALFYPRRMSLSEAEAWDACSSLVSWPNALGGVLTVSWHDRSLAPERHWGEFYRRLLGLLDQQEAVFMTARKGVSWFRARRSVRLEEDDGVVRIEGEPAAGELGLAVRVHAPGGETRQEIRWRGQTEIVVPRHETVNTGR